LIIEPDSMAKVASIRGDTNCSNLATVTAYAYGVKYAVETLYAANPEAAIYLDAAHGGDLGYSKNMDQFIGLVGAMDIASKLRGFATNVANYQPLG